MIYKLCLYQDKANAVKEMLPETIIELSTEKEICIVTIEIKNNDDLHNLIQAGVNYGLNKMSNQLLK